MSRRRNWFRHQGTVVTGVNVQSTPGLKEAVQTVYNVTGVAFALFSSIFQPAEKASPFRFHTPHSTVGYALTIIGKVNHSSRQLHHVALLHSPKLDSKYRLFGAAVPSRQRYPTVSCAVDEMPKDPGVPELSMVAKQSACDFAGVRLI